MSIERDGPAATPGTIDQVYTERLVKRELTGGLMASAKQAPYRWNIRRLGLGRVLDVGCGIGRNLVHLNGDGVGIDHNPYSVAVARERGVTAYTPEQFAASPDAVPGAFDTLLTAHVLEHLDDAGSESLLRDHLPYVRSGGRIAVITPQEAGFRSDATHVTFMDFERVTSLLRSFGLGVERTSSFPLPRRFGNRFRYNEFIVLARVRAVPTRRVDVTRTGTGTGTEG